MKFYFDGIIETREVDSTEAANQLLRQGWVLVSTAERLSFEMFEGHPMQVTKGIWKLGKKSQETSEQGTKSELQSVPSSASPPDANLPSSLTTAAPTPLKRPIDTHPTSKVPDLSRDMESLKWTRSRWGEYAFLRNRDGSQTPAQRALQDAIERAGKALVIGGYRVRITKNSFFDRRKVEDFG